MTEAEEKRVNPLRTQLRKALKTALKRSLKKGEKLAVELAECAKADYYLECGEIIKANLEAVSRGMDSVELPDMYHPGENRIIALETHLKPLDNAKRYFKLQRKLNKGLEIKQRQYAGTLESSEALSALLERYCAWEEENDTALAPAEEFVLQAQALKIHVAGLEVKKEAIRKHKVEPQGVRVFESYDGMTVYVGKNARDNDNLSIRVARGNDWWFHVAAVQGSHVLVRLESKQQGLALPQETLLDAATLAVYFSKARNATRADVHYTQAKNIRKAKKAPPGQVIVNNGKTLNVRIEVERLDRLLQREI